MLFKSSFVSLYIHIHRGVLFQTFISSGSVDEHQLFPFLSNCEYRSNEHTSSIPVVDIKSFGSPMTSGMVGLYSFEKNARLDSERIFKFTLPSALIRVLVTLHQC